MQSLGHLGISSSAIQFHQGKCSTIGFGGLFSLTRQGFEIISIGWTELYMLFFHPAIFTEQVSFVKTFKKLFYDVINGSVGVAAIHVHRLHGRLH